MIYSQPIIESLSISQKTAHKQLRLHIKIEIASVKKINRNNYCIHY